MKQIHSGPMTGRAVLVTGGSGAHRGPGDCPGPGRDGRAPGDHLAGTAGVTEDAAREIRAADSRQV